MVEALNHFNASMVQLLVQKLWPKKDRVFTVRPLPFHFCVSCGQPAVTGLKVTLEVR
jgi:hypothetical protein